MEVVTDASVTLFDLIVALIDFIHSRKRWRVRMKKSINGEPKKGEQGQGGVATWFCQCGHFVATGKACSFCGAQQKWACGSWFFNPRPRRILLWSGRKKILVRRTISPVGGVNDNEWSKEGSWAQNEKRMGRITGSGRRKKERKIVQPTSWGVRGDRQITEISLSGLLLSSRFVVVFIPRIERRSWACQGQAGLRPSSLGFFVLFVFVV